MEKPLGSSETPNVLHPVLFVTLDWEIIGQRDDDVDVTRGVVSVTKGTVFS